MEKIRAPKPYFSNEGDKIQFNPKYDYLLFREDWNGIESVYFDEDEIDKIYEEICCGEILIHMNQSILFARDKRLVDKFPDVCHKTVYEV